MIEYKDKYGITINENDILEGANSVIYSVSFNGWELVVNAIAYFRGDRSDDAKNDFPCANRLADFQLSSIQIINEELLNVYD